MAGEEHIVEVKIIADPKASLPVGAGRLPDRLLKKKGVLSLDTYADDFPIFQLAHA